MVEVTSGIIAPPLPTPDRERLQTIQQYVKEVTSAMEEVEERKVNLGDMGVGEKRGCLATAGHPYLKENQETGEKGLDFGKTTRTVVAFQVEKTLRGYRCVFLAREFPEGHSPWDWQKGNPVLKDLSPREIFADGSIFQAVGGVREIGTPGGNHGFEWTNAKDERIVVQIFGFDSLTYGPIPRIGSGGEMAFIPSKDLYLGENSPVWPIGQPVTRQIESVLGLVRTDEIITHTWETKISS